MALRELALRRTADRVEDDVQAYRDDKAIERVWKTDASLLVLRRTAHRRATIWCAAPRASRRSSTSNGRRCTSRRRIAATAGRASANGSC